MRSRYSITRNQPKVTSSASFTVISPSSSSYISFPFFFLPRCFLDSSASSSAISSSFSSSSSSSSSSFTSSIPRLTQPSVTYSASSRHFFVLLLLLLLLLLPIASQDDSTERNFPSVLHLLHRHFLLFLLLLLLVALHRHFDLALLR